MTRRRLGWALAVYGALGLLLLVVGGAIGLDAVARAGRLMGGADSTLTAATRTASAAAAAFRSSDDSLGQGQASAERAASLARDASATLAELGQAMEVSIFGAQPLIGLADDFARSADQAGALGGELDAVGASLGSSREDLVAVADRLAELSRELDGLRGAGGPAGSQPPLGPLVVVLIAWLALPSIAALVAAGWLLRGPRPVPPGT